MSYRDTEISMVRGDSETITLTIKQSDGEDYPLENGDIIYFTVKQHANTSVKLLQKKITTFEGSQVIIDIEPTDTKTLRFDRYVYDIQLTRKNGDVHTIVPYSRFIVTEEVTYE